MQLHFHLLHGILLPIHRLLLSEFGGCSTQEAVIWVAVAGGIFGTYVLVTFALVSTGLGQSSVLLGYACLRLGTGIRAAMVQAATGVIRRVRG